MKMAMFSIVNPYRACRWGMVGRMNAKACLPLTCPLHFFCLFHFTSKTTNKPTVPPKPRPTTKCLSACQQSLLCAKMQVQGGTRRRHGRKSHTKHVCLKGRQARQGKEKGKRKRKAKAKGSSRRKRKRLYMEGRQKEKTYIREEQKRRERKSRHMYGRQMCHIYRVRRQAGRGRQEGRQVQPAHGSRHRAGERRHEA